MKGGGGADWVGVYECIQNGSTILNLILLQLFRRNKVWRVPVHIPGGSTSSNVLMLFQ